MTKNNQTLLMSLSLIIIFISACSTGEPGGFDLIIRNGKVINGTGNPWFYADIGIRGDTIIEIGNLSDATAVRIIDAEGLVVSPGFIDVHTHVAGSFSSTDANAIVNYLIQGVTTVEPSSDGGGTYKIAETKQKWEAGGMGTNATMFVGFNSLRREVLGENQFRSPTSEELEQMKTLVRQAMQEGAWGLTTGIEYGGLDLYSTTEEIIEVTKPIAEFGGVYKSHMRDEAKFIVEAVEELIRIGEEAGVPVSITHLKPAGKDSWGLMKDVVRLVNDARSRGIMVTADKYPWLQGAPIGFITSLIDVPEDMVELTSLRRGRRNRELSYEEREELRNNYVEALQNALKDNAKRERLRESTYEIRPGNLSSVARWGWQDFRIKVTVKNPQLAEKNIAELIEEQGRDGFDIIADLIIDEPDMLFASASMSIEDFKLGFKQEWVMVSSDGGGFPIIEESAPPVRGHPRPF
ncbi:amidohydrolase family protein, partial [candidate division KSB1 bacterium]|nr:amidohydrolase family protein [candidate division KSB1 bacterium]